MIKVFFRSTVGRVSSEASHLPVVLTDHKPYRVTFHADEIDARGISEERAFDRLPILADALQDAGCDNSDVLDHCRSEGPHVRGCWVVDLLLGKS